MPNFNNKGYSFLAIIIAVAFMSAALIIAVWPKIRVEGDKGEDEWHKQKWSEVLNTASSLNEKSKIEKWIVDNELNQYGDPAETLYETGVPVDEDGKAVDRYEYIKTNHPDKPWEN